jgi:hypothetical protein
MTTQTLIEAVELLEPVASRIWIGNYEGADHENQYVYSEDGDGEPLQTEHSIFDGEIHVLCNAAIQHYIDSVALAQPVSGWRITEAALAALRRFDETCEDDQSYDVPKDTMKQLARIGVVYSAGFGRYGVTDFGRSVLDLPPAPTGEPNAK